MKSAISVAVALVVTTLAAAASASSECMRRDLDIHSVVVEPPLSCAVVTVTEDCGEVIAEILSECYDPIEADCSGCKIGYGDSLIVTLSAVLEGEDVREELVLTNAGSTHTLSVTFDVHRIGDGEEGCSAAPGRVGATSAWGVLLAAAVVARGVRRRTRS